MASQPGETEQFVREYVLKVASIAIQSRVPDPRGTASNKWFALDVPENMALRQRLEHLMATSYGLHTRIQVRQRQGFIACNH